MPKIGGVDWERHPRGRYRVLLCPGRRILDPHQRCPFSVIIANPGGEVDEAAAIKAATEHYEQHHGGTWGDEWRLTTGGAPSAPLVDGGR